MFIIMFYPIGCGAQGIRFTDSKLGYYYIPYGTKTPMWIDSLWVNAEGMKSLCVPKEI